MNVRNSQKKNDSTAGRLGAIYLPIFEETDNMSRDSNPSLIILNIINYYLIDQFMDSGIHSPFVTHFVMKIKHLNLKTDWGYKYYQC